MSGRRCSVLLFFFFFQAEDGIRDLTVTGVQTCALPIFYAAAGPVRHRVGRLGQGGRRHPARCRRARGGGERRRTAHHAAPGIAATRSEEHTSELQSQSNLVCRLLLEKKKNTKT